MLITNQRLIKPDVLTTLLRSNNVLDDSESIRKLSEIGQNASDIDVQYRYAVQYASFKTQRHAPDKILVKLSKPDGSKVDAMLHEKEVEFYNRIAYTMRDRYTAADVCLVQCLDAYYDETVQGAHVILDDIDDDFKENRDPAPPSKRHREQVVDALARIHAYWWEDERIAKVTPMPSEETLDLAFKLYQQKLAEMIDKLGARLSTPHRNILTTLSQQLPTQRHANLLAGQRVTIVHNNLKPSVFRFSHRDSRILGWHHWSAGTATDDLVLMFAFYPDAMRRFDIPALLQRYHQTLLASGVQAYSYDDMLVDYRASFARVVQSYLGAWTHQNPKAWEVAKGLLNRFDEQNVMALFES